jgi:hypothetical protein
MADDPNPGLSRELLAARARLAPQLRGLGDLVVTSISDELVAKIREVQTSRQRLDGLLASALQARDAYIAALNALEADGYPNLPNVTIPNSIFSEMQEEQSDLQAAIKIFETEGMATSMSIGLGTPVAKP